MVDVEGLVDDLALLENGHRPGEFAELGFVVLVAGDPEANSINVTDATLLHDWNGWNRNRRRSAFGAARLEGTRTGMGIGLAVLSAEPDVEQSLTIGNDRAVSALEIRNAFAYTARLLRSS